MPKRIAILGSTGSIGCNAIEVIEHLGTSHRIVALSANQSIEKLIAQIETAKPQAVGIADESMRDQLQSRVRDVKVYAGTRGLCEMVRRDDVDVVLAAIVGFAGLEPVLAAVEAGKTVALANKESLVVAGSILIPLAKKTGAKIIPVDSEHSAIFQAMTCGKLAEIERVILTASGGPFREWPVERIARATREDALNHPTWKMGEKITIDSATMFNKALEIIEACWLFDLSPRKIGVVIHPESIVHSMVEFVDGSTIAQLSPPDMKTPIQFALTYPDRAAGIGRRMDWKKSVALNFFPPDEEKFPALRLAHEVAEKRGTFGAVLNAANEAAVSSFLAGKIAFGMIWQAVERTIREVGAQHRSIDKPTLEDLKSADRWARATAASILDE